MTIRYRSRFDTGARMSPGERVVVGWTPVRDPAPDDETVRLTAREAGAAVVRRGEGISFRAGDRGPELVMTATAVGGKSGVVELLMCAPAGSGRTSRE
jgi:hypothetical protein